MSSEILPLKRVTSRQPFPLFMRTRRRSGQGRIGWSSDNVDQSGEDRIEVDTEFAEILADDDVANLAETMEPNTTARRYRE